MFSPPRELPPGAQPNFLITWADDLEITNLQAHGLVPVRVRRPTSAGELMLIDSIPELLSRFWQEIAARPTGPLAFRFYLQPAMATFFAIRDGLRDARAGNPPYFWSLFTDPQHRREQIRGGWQSIGKIIVLAIALDVVYQVIVLRGLRPFEAIFIAFLLAVAPYLLLRGLVTRLVRRRIGPKAGGTQGSRLAAQEGD